MGPVVEAAKVQPAAVRGPRDMFSWLFHRIVVFHPRAHARSQARCRRTMLHDLPREVRFWGGAS
eukprot:396539-Alexandrium_andersonii.AAC.1